MPLDTVLCLDTSYSMEGHGLRQLKLAVRAFLDGVSQTAIQTGLRENVAVVEFGRKNRIIHPLSTKYPDMKRAVDSLIAGGTTPMFEGLMLALQEILSHGGVVALRGTNVRLTPRVILMTDGRPDNKDKVIATAMAFSPRGYSQIGLPHPIPIACVGLGTGVDKEMLAVIATVTNGMFTIGDASILSGFFRKQVLLIRFLIQFHNDMTSLRNMLALRAFLEQLGESVANDEAEALMKLLLAMVIMEGAEHDGAAAQTGRPRAAALTSPIGYRGGERAPLLPSSRRDNTRCCCGCTIL